MGSPNHDKLAAKLKWEKQTRMNAIRAGKPDPGPWQDQPQFQPQSTAVKKK